jgi:Na+-driven multidrug efflux pump
MQGLGRGLPVLIITSIRVLGLGAPLALYFSLILDKPVEWNWYAMMFSASVSFLIAINWVRFELKKINKKFGV